MDTYPLKVASVCSWWRTVATISTPRIWTTIFVLIYRPLGLANLYLERSGDLPLDFRFWARPEVVDRTILKRIVHRVGLKSRGRNPDDVSTALGLVLGNLHRLRDLKLNFGEDELACDVMSYLHSAHAPNLRVLQISADSADIPPMFVDGGAPKLHSLDISYISSGMIHFVGSSFSSTTVIRLYGTFFTSPSGLATFLGSFPNLKQLYLSSEIHDLRALDSLPPDAFVIPSLIALELSPTVEMLAQFFMQNKSLRVIKPPSLNLISPTSALNSPWVQVLIFSSFTSIDPVEILPHAFPNLTRIVLHDVCSDSAHRIIQVLLERDLHWPLLHMLSVPTSTWREHELNLQEMMEFRNKGGRPIQVVCIPDLHTSLNLNEDSLERERFYESRRVLDLSYYL